jgi:hypothetical protein
VLTFEPFAPENSATDQEMHGWEFTNVNTTEAVLTFELFAPENSATDKEMHVPEFTNVNTN